MANLNAILHQLGEEYKRVQLEVARLDQAISAVESVLGRNTLIGSKSGRRILSAAARRRISQAQKARWARAWAQEPAGKTASKRSRTLSGVARRRVAAAQKARRAKFRAQRKNKKTA